MNRIFLIVLGIFSFAVVGMANEPLELMANPGMKPGGWRLQTAPTSSGDGRANGSRRRRRAAFFPVRCVRGSWRNGT